MPLSWLIGTRPSSLRTRAHGKDDLSAVGAAAPLYHLDYPVGFLTRLGEFHRPAAARARLRHRDGRSAREFSTPRPPSSTTSRSPR
jgi:hypothetical protein